MERLLEAGEHLAGAYTYADIAFYMAQFFAERMSAPMTSTTPRLQRWRERMTARPAVRLVIGPMAAFLKAQGRPVPGFVRELAG